MRETLLPAIVIAMAACATAFAPTPSLLARSHAQSAPTTHLSSSNSDMFGGDGGEKRASSGTPMRSVAAQNVRLVDEAAKLRQEAAEMELALRDEARAKGVPEEMINKLIPIRNPKGTSIQPATDATNVPTGTASDAPPVVALSAEAIRAKLGYIVTGDALGMTRQLDQVSSNPKPYPNPNPKPNSNPNPQP